MGDIITIDFQDEKIKKENLDLWHFFFSEKVYLTAKSGDITFLHNFILHGSDRNNSDKFRKNNFNKINQLKIKELINKQKMKWLI